NLWSHKVYLDAVVTSIFGAIGPFSNAAKLGDFSLLSAKTAKPADLQPVESRRLEMNPASASHHAIDQAHAVQKAHPHVFDVRGAKLVAHHIAHQARIMSRAIARSIAAGIKNR